MPGAAVRRRLKKKGELGIEDLHGWRRAAGVA